MKNGYLFAATGAMYLMLVSCSADEPVEKNTTDGRIDYTVVTANQSRAAHSYCANNKPDGFQVWAKYGDRIYIDGDDIRKSGDNYIDVTGSRFWPVKPDGNGTTYDPLDFYAVVDKDFAENESLFDNSGNLAPFSYTVNSDVTKQLDLMYAVKKDAQYSASQPVALNFRHALSQVCFRAKSETTTNRITIMRVGVYGLHDTGTYTLPTASTDASINDHNGPSAPTSTNRGTWTIAANAPKSAFYEITVGEGGNGVALDGTEPKNLITFSADHTNMDWSKVLNLLPQEQPAAVPISNSTNPAKNGISGAYFKLTIKVENKGKDEGGMRPRPVYDKDGNDCIDVYLGVNINWKEGNRYIYTFNFGKDFSHEDLTGIDYSVTADDFIDNEEVAVVINGHAAVLMREAKDGVPALYVATRNIGVAEDAVMVSTAATRSVVLDPTRSGEFGLYFWWGDTVGRPYVNHADPVFNRTNSDVITYQKTQDALYAAGIVNADGNLVPEYDAAHVQWGGPWRMPTKADFQWLIENCWKYRVVTGEDSDGNGVPDTFLGMRYVSKTTEGEIFLPNAGCYDDNYYPGDGTWDDCYYWSSTMSYYFGAHAQNYGWVSDTGSRSDGFSIRAVANTAE